MIIPKTKNLNAPIIGKKKFWCWYREVMILDCTPITHVRHFLPIIDIVGKMTMHIIRAFKGLIISKNIHKRVRAGGVLYLDASSRREKFGGL
jgi:hypothetical protein